MQTKYKGHHFQLKKATPTWVAKSTSTIPLGSQIALKEAMKIEGVSISEYSDLLWIMAQESGGRVNAKNSASSARGLFQLLRAQYELNPNGEDSFGNAVEECQGGIHYIMGRYHTASAARAFWEKHHWY
jgi:SLT domain-containing protein